VWNPAIVPSDTASYDDLYEGNRVRIARLCTLLLADGRLAEDVCQEVFLKLHVAMDGSTQTVDWDRWLTRVAVNACKDIRRSAWWRRVRSRREDFDESAFSASGEEPERSARNRQIRSRVRQALGQLPNRQRQVFVLRHIEGWSTEEVATALSMSTGTAKRHLFRAVARLRAVLGDLR